MHVHSCPSINDNNIHEYSYFGICHDYRKHILPNTFLTVINVY